MRMPPDDRLRLSMAASALSGVPSVNERPSRTLIVHTVASSLGSMLSPRKGCTSRFWSTTKRGSMKARMRIWQYESHCTFSGVHGAPTSASPATTSLPP